MNTEELKPIYTLEDHLAIKCKLDESYIDLISTWKLNKKTLKEILKTIIINYPHFTEHDDNHANTIINNIEMLLGEERIKMLSATDTWMLLQCAYLHDFGMAILYKKIEEVWQSPEFREYIEEKKSYDADIKEAAEYIESLGEKLKDKEFEVIWPLKIRKYVTRIIANYFRLRHSELTKEYLNSMLNEWNIDLSHNNLIKNRLIKVIAQISFIHTQDFDSVLKLDYESNGFRSDYFHPRFIAEMLRMGDLLDLDNGRYNDYVKNVVGDIPEYSEVHIEKHNSITQLLITPELIEVKADCHKRTVYRATRDWMKWLDDEIKNLTLKWTEIIPKNLSGYAPKFKKLLYYKGEEDFNNLTDLRFQISQEKAFDLIEGSGLYKDEFVFMREFIQNALDATKIQLWRDIKSGIYDSWLDSDIEKNNLSPFDIDKKIYENYEIKIDVVPKENKYFEVIIKDRGTGISIESLKAMGEVAKSYKERKTIRNEINEMPSWLKPTGGFGIGIQTAFLINKEFIAYTKSTLTDKVLEIVFESRNKNGYIQANNSEHKMQRGTEFHILVKKDNFKYSLGGFVSNYISSGYDPMNNDDLLAYRILDSVQEYCNSIFIPVSINYNNVNLPKKTYENMSFKNSNNSYNYSISDSFDEIYIWDKDSCSYIRMKMGFKSANYRIDVYYKGIAVNKGVSEINEIPYIYCYIDTHGFNMKQILKLNREELTKYGIKAVADIYYKAGELFMKVINKALEDGKSIDSNIVTVFLLLAPRFKINVDNSKYKDLVKDSKYEIKVVEKDNGKFVEGTKSINDIIDNYPNFNYLNIEDFRVYGLKKIDYNMDSILKALNSKITEIDTNFIIADEKFIDNMLKYCKIESIRYIKTHKSKTLIIYRINEKNLSDFINTDKYTRDEFVKMLVYDQKKSNRSHRLIDINSERSCIPAMEDYKDLAVSKIPHGISQVQDKVNIVISPLTKSDGNYIKNINNYDSFIDNIVKRNDYQNLLDYVYENRLEDNKVTRDDIDELYRKLIKEYYDLIKNKNN